MLWARERGLDEEAIASKPALSALHRIALLGGDESLVPSNVVATSIDNICELSRCLESIRHKASPKFLGIAWTPIALVDAILNFILPVLKSDDIYLDPACGSGIFLLRLVQRLLAETSRRDLPRALSRVYGLDIDARAILYSRALLELLSIENGFENDVHRINLICGDFLDPSSWVDDVISSAGGATAIFGNPPYVRLQDLPPATREQVTNRFGHLLQGSFSSSQAFLLGGIAALQESGRLGFVTQNNFATSKSASSIRAWLQQNGHMRRYIDFSHTKLFDGQSAYACLLFAARAYEPEFEFGRAIGNGDVASLTTIPLSRLHASKWRLADSRQLRHLEQLEGTGIRLGAFADIKVGFATLADRVFLLTGNQGSGY